MPELLKCWSCQGKVSSQAVRKVDGKVVCPRCVETVKKAAELRKANEKKSKAAMAAAAAAARAKANVPADADVAAGTDGPATPPARKPSSRSRIRKASSRASIPAGDPEIARLVRSGSFLKVFTRIQAVLCFLFGAAALAGGAVGAMGTISVEGAGAGVILAMGAGGAASGVIFGIFGAACWMAGSWVSRASSLIAEMAEGVEEDGAGQDLPPVSRPRIIMPQSPGGN